MTRPGKLIVFYTAACFALASAYAVASYFLRVPNPPYSGVHVGFGLFIQCIALTLLYLYFRLLPQRSRVLNVPYFGLVFVAAVGFNMLYSGLHCAFKPFPLKNQLCW